MRTMRIREEDLIPLGELLSQLSEIPPERVAAFVVTMAVWEEDGSPSGRMIASTHSLRAVAMVLDVARGEVQQELDKLAGMS